jgi:hypothetical protein
MWASHFTPEGGWSEPEELNVFNEVEKDELCPKDVQLRIDNSGNARAYWAEGTKIHSAIYD